MSKILITPRSLTKERHPALNLLKQAGYELIMGPPGKQPSEEELLKLLPGCIGYLAGVEKISAQVLESSVDLKVISRNGTGIDNIDLETAQRLGIRIYRAEGANAQGVAELTLGLILSLVRSLPLSDTKMKAGLWERKMGFEIFGKTLGIIGCGKIGQKVTLLALGIGMKVIGFDPIQTDFCSYPDFYWVKTIEELFAQSDIISLHCPALKEGIPVIKKDHFILMKPGVYLVNTARAELIDEIALLDALNSGKLAGVAMDVFQEEPPQNAELVKHERVIATPHIGAYTRESISRATFEAVNNLLKYL